MLTRTQILAIKYRAKLVQANLKNCHSGADVHTVGSMLQTAEGILELVDHPDTGEELLELLTRVEHQQVEFFKRKFPASIASHFTDQETMKTKDSIKMESSKETETTKPSK
jgi:hypothetical protein